MGVYDLLQEFDKGILNHYTPHSCSKTINSPIRKQPKLIKGLKELF